MALVATATQACFVDAIGNFSEGSQENYLVDGYYYMYIGEIVNDDARTSGNLLRSVEYFSPNVASRGIVYLNALLEGVLPSRWLFPVLFTAAYAAIFVGLAVMGRLNAKLLVFPFTGLAPYLFIPSKEAFFVLGFILAVIACLKRRLFIVGMAGLVLMYLARPEGVYLIAIGCAAWLVLRRKRIAVVVLIAMVAVYCALARNLLFELSAAYQMITDGSEMAFCKVGPFSVCVDSPATVELVYVQRVLSLAALPIKWLWDFVGLVTEKNAPTWIIRTAIIAHMLWLYRVVRTKAQGGPDAWLRSLVATIVVVYVGAFAALMYYQATRQVLLATTLLGVVWSVTSCGEQHNAEDPRPQTQRRELQSSTPSFDGARESS